MSNTVLQPVVMIGGSGTGHRPLSHDAGPRQLSARPDSIGPVRMPLRRTDIKSTHSLGPYDLLCVEDTYGRA